MDSGKHKAQPKQYTCQEESQNTGKAQKNNNTQFDLTKKMTFKIIRPEMLIFVDVFAFGANDAPQVVHTDG